MRGAEYQSDGSRSFVFSLSIAVFTLSFELVWRGRQVSVSLQTSLVTSGLYFQCQVLERGIKYFFFAQTLTYSFFLVSEMCDTALGMEKGRIPDSAITASSSYELKSVGPQNAR